MERKCYYRKGASVIYHYKVFRKVYWSESGYGWVREWKRATLVLPPRDEYGRFTNREWDIATLRLKDDKGKVFDASIDDVEKDRKMTDLSREEIIMIWGQICRGSMYYSDYANSVGVFENTAMYTYEGFWQYLSEEYGERAEEEDTPENFADYVEGYFFAA